MKRRTIVTIIISILFCVPSISQSIPRVIYSSQLLGGVGDADVSVGSTTTGTDRASEINAALSSGNVKLIVDGHYGLSTSLVLYSNTEIECLPGAGFIMQPGTNAPIFVNAHMNAPTTAVGTGFAVSNQVDRHLRVHGCMWNENSTQAVTGSTFSAHQLNPATQLWVFGVMLVGVDDLDIHDNEFYDSGTFNLLLSNVSNVHIDRNYPHQPFPLVQYKNTDGIHFIGPANNLWVNGNRVNAGDDSIAFNADDAHRSNAQGWSFMQYPQLRWGPITNVYADSNTFDNSTAGYRLYSCDSFIDNVTFTNTKGVTLGESLNFTTPDHDGGHGCGPGNIGKVVIKGWQVNFTGAFTAFYQAGFYITANIKSLTIDDVQVSEPGANWPIFWQQYGTIQNFTHSNWQIGTQTSNTNTVIKTDGAIANINGSSIIWDDNIAHSGSFYGGQIVPAKLNLSAYFGPSRILASGYSPTVQNGDAFATSSSAPAATVYVNTNFSEASSGNLTGTTPSVCTNGCTGTWMASTTGGVTAPWTYQNPGIKILNSPGNFSPQWIDVGHSDYVLRVQQTPLPVNGLNGAQIVVRVTPNTGNYVAVQTLANSLVVTDASNGTYTNIGTPTPNGCGSNQISVIVSGNAVTASCGGMSTGGNLPASSVNTTSTKAGFLACTGYGWSLQNFSVLSQ